MQLVHTEEVTGSIPASPTQLSGRFRPWTRPFLILAQHQSAATGIRASQALSLRSASILASAAPASLADFLADSQAPSRLIRVGTLLALHFPADSHRLCLDRPGLLLQGLGRPLFAILPGPAAKETHDVAKEIHSVIIGRPACGLLDSRSMCRR